jgi:double-strand break repair protein MRE11
VVWGHEHESRPLPEEFVEPGFHVIQPGSSVCTSLSVGESLKKHISLVQVRGTQFKVTALPLLSVRPLILEEAGLMVDLSVRVAALAAKGAEEGRERWAKRQAWLNLAGVAKCVYRQGERDFCEKPLIRLKVPAGAGKTTNQKFGLQFSDVVGNPENLLHFSKKTGRPGNLPGLAGLEFEDGQVVNEDLQVEQTVQDLIFNYMNPNDPSCVLEVFPEHNLNQAVQAFVISGESQAIDRYVKQVVSTASRDLVCELSKDRAGRVFEKDKVSRRVKDWLRAKTDHIRRDTLVEESSASSPVLLVSDPQTAESDRRAEPVDDFWFDENVSDGGAVNSKKRPLEEELQSQAKRRPPLVASPKPKAARARKPLPLLSQQSRSIRN